MVGIRRRERNRVKGVENVDEGIVMEIKLSYFFFQAEDGIRDYKVTGVQTCALPIFRKDIVLALICPLFFRSS